MRTHDEYCAFTKAVENLGDRWSLLILGRLERHGALGFNAIVELLPGIPRGILVQRLKRLDELGLVTRLPGGRRSPYCLTAAGEQLGPMFQDLKTWAERWVPEDPAVAERDPDLIAWWLRHRVDDSRLPARPVVLDLEVAGTRSGRFWLVLALDSGAAICDEDPRLDGGRYVYVQADAAAIESVARGARGWRDAIGDGSVSLFGDPGLIRELPLWFRDMEAGARGAP